MLLSVEPRPASSPAVWPALLPPSRVDWRAFLNDEAVLTSDSKGDNPSDVPNEVPMPRILLPMVLANPEAVEVELLLLDIDPPLNTELSKELRNSAGVRVSALELVMIGSLPSG